MKTKSPREGNPKSLRDSIMEKLAIKKQHSKFIKDNANVRKYIKPSLKESSKKSSIEEYYKQKTNIKPPMQLQEPSFSAINSEPIKKIVKNDIKEDTPKGTEPSGEIYLNGEEILETEKSPIVINASTSTERVTKDIAVEANIIKEPVTAKKNPELIATTLETVSILIEMKSPIAKRKDSIIRATINKSVASGLAIGIDCDNSLCKTKTLNLLAEEALNVSNSLHAELNDASNLKRGKSMEIVRSASRAGCMPIIENFNTGRHLEDEIKRLRSKAIANNKDVYSTYGLLIN